MLYRRAWGDGWHDGLWSTGAGWFWDVRTHSWRVRVSENLWKRVGERVGVGWGGGAMRKRIRRVRWGGMGGSIACGGVVKRSGWGGSNAFGSWFGVAFVVILMVERTDQFLVNKAIGIKENVALLTIL